MRLHNNPTKKMVGSLGFIIQRLGDVAARLKSDETKKGVERIRYRIGARMLHNSIDLANDLRGG